MKDIVYIYFFFDGSKEKNNGIWIERNRNLIYFYEKGRKIEGKREIREG